MAPPTYFPLRWESTGDQWWYASPIDWAAANGHYDLVRELLRIDPNHIIKLTSLRRIRRLETVWDDEEHFHDVARCRSEVARKLFTASNNSLVGAGYGGWLLYTAASAGDLGFVRELLEMDPLLVFGEGEYGVTDILYAAARSKNSQVFGYVFDHAASPRFSTGAEHELPPGYKLEIMNRAVHAAARGGNLKLLKELISSSPSNDLLAYRDNQGATILHAAAARGQVEVVKHLSLSSPDILKLTDNGGNTALHVASHRGHLPVVQALIQASPSCVNVTSRTGETFIHSAVSGFQTPGFQRVDRQMDLLKHLLSSKLVDIRKLINARNIDGRTALHLAIMGNVHSDLVELLMTVPGIDINICDTGGMTPLDALRHSPSSDLLTRQLISAGGIFGCQDRRAIASHIKRQSIGGSPGTSFRISDVDIFLYSSARPNSNFDMTNNHSLKSSCNLPLRADSAAQRLKRFLHWPNMRKGTTAPERLNEAYSGRGHAPLRQRFSKTSLSLPNNKRRLSVRSNVPSPMAKKKLASGVEHGMLQSVSRLKTQKGAGEGDWCSSSGVSDDIYCGAKNQKRFMNRYLCFGHGPRQPTGVVRSVFSAA